LKPEELEELAKAFQQLNRPANEIETMLTIRDIQRIFRMKYDAALRLVQETLVPLGAANKIREKYYISPWGVRRLANQTGRCPCCGQRWTAWRELEYLSAHGIAPDPVTLRTEPEEFIDVPPIPKERERVKPSGPRSWEKRKEYQRAIKPLIPEGEEPPSY